MASVVIIGAGPAGLLAAYKLSHQAARKAEITVIDMGREANRRYCHERGKGNCVGCNPCNKLTGAGGAGLMTDGKLLFHHKVGNNLDEIIGMQENLRLIDEIKAFFLSYGVSEVQEKPREVEELERRALQNEIDFIYPKQTHIGSDKLPKFIMQLQADLERKGVKFIYNKKIERLDELNCDFTLLAPGRYGIGSDWMERILRENELSYTFRPVDIGVRVEVPHQITDEITDITRDMKFYIRTRCHDDEVRTFCTCPRGFIGREKYEGFNIVNGEASKEIKSGNTNFAVLVTVPLTKPLANPNEVARLVGSSFHAYGGGRIMAQRFEDLQKGKRSWDHKQDRYILQPTLKEVTWGDISLPLSGRYVDDIKEMLHRLNSIMPGVAGGQTILYGPEIKFHGLKIKTNEYLHAGNNIYVAGDGAGLSRGIVGAAASGILAAEGILKRL